MFQWVLKCSFDKPNSTWWQLNHRLKYYRRQCHQRQSHQRQCWTFIYWAVSAVSIRSTGSVEHIPSPWSIKGCFIQNSFARQLHCSMIPSRQDSNAYFCLTHPPKKHGIERSIFIESSLNCPVYRLIHHNTDSSVSCQLFTNTSGFFIWKSKRV